MLTYVNWIRDKETQIFPQENGLTWLLLWFHGFNSLFFNSGRLKEYVAVASCVYFYEIFDVKD